MNVQNTLKEIIKEKLEYKQLFKIMLAKSGKDINSMSDEDKKKFFNAVDKAYKAKTEGKLGGYKQSMNEDFWSDLLTNPFFYLLLSKFVVNFLRLGLFYAVKFVYKKDYAKSVKIILDKLQDDDGFIKKVTDIIYKDKKMTEDTAIKIVNLPEVEKLCKEESDKAEKSKEHPIIAISALQNELGQFFLKAWKDNTIKNTIIDKIKNDIK